MQKAACLGGLVADSHHHHKVVRLLHPYATNSADTDTIPKLMVAAPMVDHDHLPQWHYATPTGHAVEECPHSRQPFLCRSC